MTTTTTQIPLSDAIQQLRDELRGAIIEGRGKDIVFTPKSVELELSVTFGTEAKVGGGFKLLTFLDLSAEGKASVSHAHKVKLQLEVSDEHGNPIKVRDTDKPTK